MIAQQAAQLTVFQRTPNFSIPSRNGPMTDDLRAVVEVRLSDAARAGAAHAHRHPEQSERRVRARGVGRGAAAHLRGALGRRRHQLHGGVQRPDLRSRRPTTPRRISCATRSARWCAIRRWRNCWRRRTIPIGTKRICVDTDYYGTYNRDNVTLVDVRTTPISEITANGLRAGDAEYELDAIVFATGFDAMTGALLKHRHRGRRHDAAARNGRPGRAPISA